MSSVLRSTISAQRTTSSATATIENDLWLYNASSGHLGASCISAATRRSRRRRPPCRTAPTRPFAPTTVAASCGSDSTSPGWSNRRRSRARLGTLDLGVRARGGGRRARRHGSRRVALPRRPSLPPALPLRRAVHRPSPSRLYDEGAACVTVPVRRAEPRTRRTRASSPRPPPPIGALPPGVEEGLMLAEDGSVLEGLSSNFFAVKGGRALAPRRSACSRASRAPSCSRWRREVLPVGTRRRAPRGRRGRSASSRACPAR